MCKNLTSCSACLCSLSFSSISRSSSCLRSNAAFKGPQQREYSTIAIVYCTRVAQSSLEYLAAAMVIPFDRPWGDGDLLAWNVFSAKRYNCKNKPQKMMIKRKDKSEIYDYHENFPEYAECSLVIIKVCLSREENSAYKCASFVVNYKLSFSLW